MIWPTCGSGSAGFDASSGRPSGGEDRSAHTRASATSLTDPGTEPGVPLGDRAPARGVIALAVDRMEVRRMYGQALRADGFRTLEVDGLTDLRELLSRDPTDILIIGRRFGGGDTLDGVSDFRGDHPGLRFLVLGGPADALDAAPVLD